MSRVKEKRSRLGMVRVLSLAVIGAAVFFGGSDTLTGEPGGQECSDYFIHMCLGPASDCDRDMGAACGEAIPGCAGQGKIECQESSICAEDTVMWRCSFPDDPIMN